MLIRANSFWIPLADESVHCVVTSPPYWGLRDYKLPPLVWPANGNRSSAFKCAHAWDIREICDICGAWRGALGLEPTPELYVSHIVEIFREVRRVLRSDGTLWLNMGDCYATGAGTVGECPGGGARLRRDKDLDPKRSAQSAAQPFHFAKAGLKAKDLVGMPWRVAFALQADGWYLRRDIIWSKPNPMPESVPDRPTTAHEYIFLFSKSGDSRYWTHSRGKYPGSREAPEPDYIWVERRAEDAELEEDSLAEAFINSREEPEEAPRQELAIVPFGWTAEKDNPVNRQWRRVNLWRSHDYFFDKEAIAEAQSESERTRRLREHEQRLDSRYPLARDNQTGLHNPSDAGVLRSSRARQEIALRGTRQPRSVWEIPTQAFRGAHFATFPEEIPRRAIAAGTSERGCCPDCDAPWERIVLASGGTIGQSWHDHLTDGEQGRILKWGSGGTGKASKEGTYRRTSTGWQPTCRCSLNPNTRHLKPALVLDPFGGSGTVGAVAFKMGRRFLCLELKEEYLELAKERIPPMAFVMGR